MLGWVFVRVFQLKYEIKNIYVPWGVNEIMSCHLPLSMFWYDYIKNMILSSMKKKPIDSPPR